MGMQASGEINVDVDRTTAFSFVADPLRLAQCIPGCHNLRELSPGRYAAELTSRVAYITLKFKVVGEVVKMEPPNVIEVKMTGEAIGIPGHIVATVGLHLSDAGERRALIRYAADVVLTGKLGGLGQPVFRAKSAELAREFAANLKAAMERGSGEVPA